jgi:hypothetical protein
MKDPKDPEAIANYVDAACALHQLSFNPEQRARIIQTFATNAQAIAPLMEFELPTELEMAPVFKA